MKENKNFFGDDHLNKGYSRSTIAPKQNSRAKNKLHNNQGEDSSLKDRNQHILPPIEIIEYYEDLYPGTFEKLLDMAEKEQNHRHTLELITLERKNRVDHFGRLLAILFVLVVCVTTILLSMFSTEDFLATIFAVSAFAAVALVSYLNPKKNYRSFSKRRPKNNYKNFNSKYRA